MSDNLTRKIDNLSPEKRAIFLKKLIEARKSKRDNQVEQAVISGSLPFTSGQCWLLEELNASNPRYFNIIFYMEVLKNLDRVKVEQTIRYLMTFHESLRLYVMYEEGMWRQRISEPADTVPFTWIQLAGISQEKLRIIIADIVKEMQVRINQTLGPLLHITYLDLGPQQPARLIWMMNHFITDGYSDQILFEDFSTVYRQLSQGEEIHLSPKTTSYKRWTEKLIEYMYSPAAQQELEEYWLKLPWDKVKPAPLDFPEGKVLDPKSLRYGFGTELSSQTAYASLSSQETRYLQEEVLGAKVQLMDLVLTALAYVFVQWSGSPLFYALVQDHGRETIFDDIDLSRTVGYIAYSRRILLDLRDIHTLEEAFKATREQLSCMPNKGRTLDLFVRRGDGTPVSSALAQHPHADVALNFLGWQYQSASRSSFLQSLPDEFVPVQDPKAFRNHIFKCTGGILNDQLLLEWEYSASLHKRATVEELANNFIEALRMLIAALPHEQSVHRARRVGT